MSRGCRYSGAHCTAPSLFAWGARVLRNRDGFLPSGRRQLRFVRFGPDLSRDLASLSRSMTRAPAQEVVMRRDVHALHSR